MRKASATDPTAIPPINFSEKRNLRPSNPLIAAPISGSRGTNQMYLYIKLPLQKVDLVYPDRFLVSVERDDDAKTDSCLGRGHDDHEHREYLTGHRVQAACFLQVPGECDEVQIRRVQNQLDPLSSIFMLIVTGVGLCIFIFATGYMHGETGFYRFFAYMGMFMFAMLVLVMGSNFLMMFVGWEGVGLCS